MLDLSAELNLEVSDLMDCAGLLDRVDVKLVTYRDLMSSRPFSSEFQYTF